MLAHMFMLAENPKVLDCGLLRTTSIEMSSQTGSKTHGGSQIRQLGEDEKQAKAADLVFYILCREKARPLHRRPDFMKAADLVGKSKNDQEEVLEKAANYLSDTFGFELKCLDNVDPNDPAKYKNCYILINSLMAKHDVDPKFALSTGDDGESDEEKAKTSLLFTILTLIFMSNGSVVRDDVLDGFLTQMGLKSEDNAEDDDSNNHRADIKSLFGDVKALIKDEFCKKQHYIDMTEV